MQSLFHVNVRWQFKATLREGARKSKVNEKLKHVDVQYNQEERPRKKVKSRNGEKLDSSCSVVQVEESGNSANKLNFKSISKSDNLTKLAIAIALWLYVIIVSRTSFRVNLYAAWMSRNSLLEAGAISGV